MPLESDIPSTARRVAVYIRARSKFSEGDNPLLPDLVALLPVLDAVATGQDVERVERWENVFCEADGFDPDDRSRHGDPTRKGYRALARAAIALADAERAAQT